MPQAEANVVSQNLLVSTSRKEISWCNRFGQGSGGGLLRAGAWGPGPQGLGVRAPAAWGRAPRSLGPGKSPGGGLAKGWESAETAAADVGAWREAGTGYPPYPPPPSPHPQAAREKGRGFSPSPLLKPSNTPPKVGGYTQSQILFTEGGLCTLIVKPTTQAEGDYGGAN